MCVPVALFFYMGIKKSFFSEPIIVPVTLRQTVRTKGKVEEVEYPAIFTLNRETVGQRNEVSVAASLFSSADNLARFCKMLACEPEGFDDFPKNKKQSLEERALEYFSGGGWDSLIQYVVMEVERAQKPVEFFRGF
jgi:hypothetical protein